MGHHNRELCRLKTAEGEASRGMRSLWRPAVAQILPRLGMERTTSGHLCHEFHRLVVRL